jgi:hypothetical protein
MEAVEQAPEVQTPIESPSYKDAAIMERFREMSKPANPEPEKPAEAPPVEKKAEPQEIPEEVITGRQDPEEELLTASPKGPLKHENWAKLQAKAKEWQAKAREFEEKLRTPTIPEDFKNDFEAAKAKLAEREAELERIAVERSPKFRELFTSKEEGLKTAFQATAKELDLDQDTADAIFNSKGKKRYELIDDLDIPQSAKADITTMLRQKDAIGSEREEFLAQSNEKLSKWNEEQKAQEDSRIAKLHEHETRIFEGKLSELTKTMPVLQKIEGNDKWNAAVDQNIAEARRFFEGRVTADEAADYAIAATVSKQVFRMFEVTRERLQAATEELNRLKAAAPSVENPGNKFVEDDSKLSFEERAKKTFNQMKNPSNNGFR